MFIQRVIIKNYRCLKHADVTFNSKMNVIVGNNECGKLNRPEIAGGRLD